jgi:phosphatidylserine/phosphatidylglycerophosphate/cardiolipin synthase-like enzyme
MKHPFIKFLLALLVVAFAPLQAEESKQPSISVYFSPRGGCTNAVVKTLNGAKSKILVQAYSFTSAPIAKALVDAKKRGVNVQAILDKSQKTERYSSATFLTNSGISTYIDASHKIAHNKIIIIDGRTVITGSFNFTKSAGESNAVLCGLLIAQHRSPLSPA